MARGHTNFRVGMAGAHRNHKRDTCSSGGFYKSPTAGQTVQASTQLDISWDTSCMTTDAIDIYLYAPSSAQSRIHLWENVNFALGSYQTTLAPKWWNSTSSVNLQLAIVPSGTPPFLASLPAGPVFTVTSSGTTSGTTTNANTAGAIEQVNNFSHHGPAKGTIAAAVLIPLIIIGALITTAYIRLSRAKGKEKRRQWTENVDKRMSTISTDWKAMSAAGATAAIRNSMAVPAEGGVRASSFSFGAIRPVSSIAEDGGQAGIGIKRGIDTTTPQMSQLRTGLRNPTTTERVSRVSFAADTRPSGESRRTTILGRSSRAFHTGHVPVPPLPERQDSGELSPVQTAGPLSLTAEDIRSRMSGQDSIGRPSVDEVMPALSMMRTGLKSTDDLLLPPKSPLPAPPPPAQVTTSPIMGSMPMQPMPASFMSPDEMLRAYAERRTLTSPPPANGPAVPAPVANYNGNGMRILYSPTTPDSSAAMIPPSPESAYSYSYRKSLAPTEQSKYDDDDAYAGTAE